MKDRPRSQLNDLPENLYSEFIERPQARPDIEMGRPRNIALRGRFSSYIINAVDNSNQVLNANPRRIYLIIQNNGANPVYVNFGNKATPGNITIIASGNYEPVVCPIDSVNLICDAGLSSQTAIIEGVEVGRTEV